MSPVWVLPLFHFWVVNPSRCFLCLYTSFFCFLGLLSPSLHLCFYFAVCCIRCPCPCLHAWVAFSTAYRATFLKFHAVASSLFLLSVCFCLCFLFYRDDVLCWLLSCPFSSVCFPCLSPIPGLIWFGAVYLVTGFVADQLIM